MRKEPLNRILTGLTHPVVLFSVFVLLINDWWLKIYFSSWWTGKISDAAMLILAPFLVMIVLVWFIPQQRFKWLPWLGFSIPVGLFALGKSIPVINDVIYSGMDWMFPFPVHFVFDPSDLICLVFFPLGILVWHQTRQRQSQPVWRWVWVGFVLLAALGDAAAPDYGVNCVSVNESGVWARIGYFDQVYLSKDSGLSWQVPEQSTDYPGECFFHHNEIGDETVIEDMNGGQWRFIAGEKVEFSTDGESWMDSLTLNQISEADEAYMRQKHSNFIFIHGPLEVVQDPLSGNIIAAMGQEGILVHQQSNGWLWVNVGGYGPEVSLQMAGVNGLIELLFGEILLTLFFGIYLISLLNLTRNRRWWRIVKVIFAFIGWTATILFSPAIADTYISTSLWVIAIPAAAFWALFCLVDDIVSWVKNPSSNWRFMVNMGVMVWLFNLAVFFAWGVNRVKHYSTALLIVFLISLIMAFGGTIWARRKCSRVEEERNETRS